MYLERVLRRHEPCPEINLLQQQEQTVHWAKKFTKKSKDEQDKQPGGCI